MIVYVFRIRMRFFLVLSLLTFACDLSAQQNKDGFGNLIGRLLGDFVRSFVIATGGSLGFRTGSEIGNAIFGQSNNGKNCHPSSTY